MIVLIVGLVLFLGIHSISIAAPDWRNAQIEKLQVLATPARG